MSCLQNGRDRFGTTGFVTQNREIIELAFDQNCQGRGRSAKLEFPSKISNSLLFSTIQRFVCFCSGLFFEKHLKYIKLSENFVAFSKKDLTYLLKDNYDKTFLNEVYQTPIVTFEELRRGIVNSKGPVRIQYNNRNQYKSAAKSLGIMDDFKVCVFDFLSRLKYLI